MRVTKDRQRSQRADLELFAQRYFAEAPKKLQHGDRPDLIINLCQGQIGVEHTRIYRTSGSTSGLEPHAQEAVQHRIVEYGWKEFLTLSRVKLWLIVQFNDVTTYKKREYRVIGEVLAHVVYDAVVAIAPLGRRREGWCEIEAWRYHGQGHCFPEGIKQVSYQFVEPKLEFWGPSYSYIVPHLSVGRVGERITNKEKNIEEYLLKCDEVWLLIAVDTGMPSNHFEIDAELLGTKFQTRFSKVLIMRSLHSEIYELKVASRGNHFPKTAEQRDAADTPSTSFLI